MLFVEGAQLERMQFQSESGPHFLQMRPRAVFIELVPVVAEEHKVSLVVQSDHSAVAKLRGLRKQTSQHAADSMAQHRVEVVHDQLGVNFRRRRSVVQYVLAQLYRGHSECSGGALEQMTQDKSVWFAVLLIPDHQIGKALARFLCLLHDVLDGDILPWPILYVRNARINLFHKVKNFAFRSPIRCHEDFWSCIAVKVL